MGHKINKQKSKELNKKANPSTYNPKTYVAPLINKVNEWSQATRPATVGEIASDIFPKFIASEANTHSPEDWKEYYLAHHSESYDSAKQKLKSKFETVKGAVNSISEDDLDEWLDDFLFTKTYNGLSYQEAILEDISQRTGKSFVHASANDESAGVDGYIDGKPYSVKPESYKQTQASQQEHINATMVYYKDVSKEELEYEIEERNK